VESPKYDASYTKLRGITMVTHCPARIIDNLPIAKARLSLTGRNLVLWTDNPHFDPENGPPFPGVTLQPE